MSRIVPIIVFIGIASLIHGNHHAELSIADKVKGMKYLLKKSSAGFYATCDLVLFSEMVTFDAAEDNCAAFNLGNAEGGGHLATVNNAEKNTQIKILLEMAYPSKDLKGVSKWHAKQFAWAGLRKVSNNDGSKANRLYNPDDWAWFDQSKPEEFSRWMNNQPDQRMLKQGDDSCTDEICVQNQMRINHKGLWDDTYKFKTHPYACDWSGKYIISSKKVKWPKAKQLCANAGLIMAEVHNAEDQADIEAASLLFLGPKKEGSKDFDPDNWYWVGGRDDETEGTFKWDSTGDLVETGWAIPWWGKHNVRQPDNAGSAQHHISISKEGYWDDSYGDRKKRPFACMCPSAAG